jgi:hypothetical protein
VHAAAEASRLPKVRRTCPFTLSDERRVVFGPFASRRTEQRWAGGRAAPVATARPIAAGPAYRAADAARYLAEVPLSPDDYATLNAAVDGLRARDRRDALKAKAGGRRNAMIARVAADLERVADADGVRELPDVLRLFSYPETLYLLAYAVIQSGVAGSRRAGGAAGCGGTAQPAQGRGEQSPPAPMR